MQAVHASNRPRWKRSAVLFVVALMAILLAVGQYASAEATADEAQDGAQEFPELVLQSQDVTPTYEVDPFWPQPLPEDWVLGQVAGIDVADDDTIWLIQRPGSLTNADLQGNSEAPPVMQFDQEGNLLQAWGPASDDPRGPGSDFNGCEWPNNEHGLWIDGDDNVWLGGNGSDDHQVLKFSADGSECLLQIGEAGVTEGSNSEEFLGLPAEGSVDDEANEVYIADGYLNRRVVVFDSETGEYQRHWGAYGQTNINDDAPSPLVNFGNPTHCAELSEDDLVYVCDRPNNRMQVFTTDGTFIEEQFLKPGTGGAGSVWDLAFTPDAVQTWLLNADGTNQEVDILHRNELDRVGSFGRGGRYAGQFHWVHNLRSDSMGSVYTAEVSEGKRAQKFDFTGFEPTDD